MAEEDPSDPTVHISQRETSTGLEEIIGRRFKVLDEGFIRVVDYMGTDHAIVQAARVSYGAGTKQVHEDRGLIRYLMRHRHTTPFEMCELKLHVRVPMDCWRQWVRHRTANINEYSTRYSIAIDCAQRTSPSEWRLQSASNRQGSDCGRVPEEIGKRLSEDESRLQDIGRQTYDRRLEVGIAREQARKDLPLSTYTEAFWKIDLHNLLHFLSLRMVPSAQHEIRAYADLIGREVVSRWCPVAWEAFLDYRADSVTLSRLESEIVKCLACSDDAAACDLARSAGWLVVRRGKLVRNREREEAERKLADLGFALPWS